MGRPNAYELARHDSRCYAELADVLARVSHAECLDAFVTIRVHSADNVLRRSTIPSDS